ncbi:uncharacterized protein [Branchiostoma lanceolatum]|uniref:uncharacterized protein n=1 Tax=Branchiostoma lanceolatum TaxID=7740 RepID=UPI0034529374
MLSTMTSRPFHWEDPLHSWVKDRNIWREEYSHDWMDSFFSGWDRTSKRSGIKGYRSVAPPTCSPVFPACHTAPHGHNDVEETNTKREDYAKSWIQHLEEQEVPNLMNINFMKPHTADVNNNQSLNTEKVRNIPVAMKAAKTVKNEAKKKMESGKLVTSKDDSKKEISANKAGKSTKERWISVVREGKEGLAPIWSVQSPAVKLTGTVVEGTMKKEDYSHDWDDAEVIATQCGLSEFNNKGREELDREWRQELLYCYPWETEGAFYRDVIHVELNQKTDKKGRPVLRRELSFGS